MPGGLGDSSKIFIGSSVCDDLPKGGPPVKFILRLPKPNAASDLAQLTPNECDLLGMLVPDFMTRMYDRTHGRRPPSRGLLQPNGLTAAQAMVDAYGVAYAPRPAIAPHAAPWWQKRPILLHAPTSRCYGASALHICVANSAAVLCRQQYAKRICPGQHSRADDGRSNRRAARRGLRRGFRRLWRRCSRGGAARETIRP